MFYAIAKECESLYVKVCQRLSANVREYALGFSREHGTTYYVVGLVLIGVK